MVVSVQRFLSGVVVAGSLALVVPAGAWAQNLRLSQIDASRLLLTQTVRLYVSATDRDGQPIAGLQGFRLRSRRR